ncbi:hypothetical protein BpHYR1_004316, partial [Brachionus plicatilis]
KKLAWKNFKCFKYIPLEREKIIAAELFKYNVITFQQWTNNKRPLSHNFILTAHQNQAIVWNTDQLKEKEKISFNGLASCIETVSANEYYIGNSNGQIIKWNRKPTFYPCHQGPVSCIRDCNNGKILSISCQDNTTKLWNGKNFDLLYEVSLCMPFVGKILNCSKFAYIDQQGKLYLNQMIKLYFLAHNFPTANLNKFLANFNKNPLHLEQKKYFLSAIGMLQVEHNLFSRNKNLFFLYVTGLVLLRTQMGLITSGREILF